MVALAEVLGFDPLELWSVKPMAKADDGVWRSTEDGARIFIEGDGDVRASEKTSRYSRRGRKRSERRGRVTAERRFTILGT